MSTLAEESSRAIGRQGAEPCAWDETSEGWCESACCESFVFTEGPTKEFQFCPFCARPIHWCFEGDEPDIDEHIEGEALEGEAFHG